VRLKRRPKPLYASELTLDMTLALAALNRQGIVHYATTAYQLDCGCRALSGWDTERFHPFGGIEPCAKHRDEAQRAVERFHEVVPSERLIADLLAELLEEETGATS
jgi:hypothetical protein